MYRYAEIGRATNGRYLNALSETVDVAAAREPFRKLAEPAKRLRFRSLRQARLSFQPKCLCDACLTAS